MAFAYERGANMANVVSNFMGWFFPSLDSIPEPLQVLIGTVMLGLFFGLILRICGGRR